MGRNVAILGPRPSSFMKRATLAAELDMSESTIDTYVQRGLLPKPVRVGGLVLWYWPHVEAALLAAGSAEHGDDPFMRGVDNV